MDFFELSEAVPPEKLHESEPEPVYEPRPPVESRNASTSAPGSCPIPGELLDYLEMVGLPEDGSGNTFLCMDLNATDWNTHADDHYHIALVQGTPTPEQSEEIYRVLRPGAHILLFAPDDEPIGHTGTCNIEDAGFEVRDALAWVRRMKSGAPQEAPDDGWAYVAPETFEAPHAYIPKVKSRRDRSYGMVNAKNVHPTLKPVRVMRTLLKSVPPEEWVGDMFMGSGSTGMACVDTGHSFRGAEKDPLYQHISNARIRRWAENYGKGVLGRPAHRMPEIVSDQPLDESYYQEFDGGKGVMGFLEPDDDGAPDEGDE